MNFDGNAYVGLYLEEKLKFDYSDKELIMDYLKPICSGSVNVSYGGIAYSENDDGKSISFCPRNNSGIKIEKVEITKQKHIKLLGSFRDGIGDIEGEIEPGSRSVVTIVIDDQTKYRGIYKISFRDEKDYFLRVVKSVHASFYDGTVLDVIDSKDSIYSREELISNSEFPSFLDKVGFKPDKSASVEFEEPKKSTLVLENAFSNGSREAFVSWIDDVFKEPERAQIKKPSSKNH